MESLTGALPVSSAAGKTEREKKEMSAQNCVHAEKADWNNLTFSHCPSEGVLLCLEYTAPNIKTYVHSAHKVLGTCCTYTLALKKSL